VTILICAFLTSLLLSFLIIKYGHTFAPSILDVDTSGIQKFHLTIVPRIGGVGIFLGLLFSFVLRYFQDSQSGYFGILLLASAAPVFIVGLIEDITKAVSARTRLIAGFLSAGIAGYFLGAWLYSLQIFGLDDLMASFPLIAIAITFFAVAGVAHSFNLIDGYNGLSAMVGLIILAGIGYVAFQVADAAILTASIAMIGALLGFLVWNYPRGLIFLGDGGAYLIGFWIAELSVLLTARHQEVSKWFPLLLCLYPIFETLFTIYRRVVIKKRSAGMPDATHLHQLIHSRVVRLLPHIDERTNSVYANAATAPFLWLLASASVIPAVLFWRTQIILIIFVILFALSYVYLYWSIVRFSAPKWLTILYRFFRI